MSLVKKFIWIIAFASVWLFNGCTSSSETTRDKEDIKKKTEKIYRTMEERERERIKNFKVKEIEKLNFEYNSKEVLVRKGKISTIKYNIKGYETETIVYGKDDKMDFRYEYKYNNKGEKIETLRYTTQGSLDKKYIYEYDKIGNKIKSIRYDLNGKIEKYYLYEYDENGNLTDDIWFNADGDLEFKIKNEYDDKGNKTVTYTYNGDGELISKYVFRYDERGNVVEEVKYNDNENPLGIIQYIYKYY